MICPSHYIKLLEDVMKIIKDKNDKEIEKCRNRAMISFMKKYKSSKGTAKILKRLLDVVNKLG